MEDRNAKKVSLESIRILEEFDKDMELKLLKPKSRDCNLRGMFRFVRDTGLELADVTKSDVERFIKHLNVGEVTLENFKQIMRSFWKWYGKEEFVSGSLFNNKRRSYPKKTASEMLTEDEIELLVEHALSMRDKCIIKLTYDCALRVGELRKLNVCDVINNGGNWSLSVPNAKTGTRTIPIIYSASILSDYLRDYHAYKTRKNSPLFYSMKNELEPMRLTGMGVWWLIQRCGERAKFEKRVYPHLLRHSRLTELARRGANEQVLKFYAGWSSTSDMPAVYCHLSAKDVDETIRAITTGKKVEQVVRSSKLLPKLCPRCGTANDSTNQYCSKCWIPLNEQSAMQDIAVNEMLKSEFLKLEGVNVESLLRRYNHFKTETKDLEKFLSIFDTDSLKIEDVIDAMQMDDDALLELLGYLVSCEMINIESGQISIHRAKLQQFLQIQRRYIAER
jgi:site-specific recombinase XerD/ribosomal protein S27AE